MNMLRSILAGIALSILTVGAASAQCGTTAPANKFCGNDTGSSALAGWKSIPPTALGAIAGGTVLGNPGAASAVPVATTAPVLGIPGTSTGQLGLAGLTSGTAILRAQAAAGSAVSLLPTVAGTLVGSASGPLLIGAATGTISCPTCVTSSGGGAITGSAPISVSGGGVVSIDAPYTSLTASNGGIVYSGPTNLAILSGTATAGQMLRSGASVAPVWSTATWPATTVAGTLLISGTANTVTASATPVLGVPGSLQGTIGFAGVTSGTATVTAQATAGTPTLTLPNMSGTFAVGASTPLVLSATTGGLTCPTCVTSSGGGAITGTAPISVSAAGVVSITSPLPLTNGGSNASLTASNGGIVWSNASQMQILAGTATARLPLLSGATATPVWGAYTLPASVTSGGIPYFSSTGAESSSALLTANAIMLGGGAGAAPATLGSLGTTTTVLHGNAVGAPTFGAVVNADMATMADGTIKSNISGGVAVPADNTITAVLDKLFGTTQGSVIYRGAASWASLAPGSAGQLLQSGGPAANPSWATAGGAGTVTSVATDDSLYGGPCTVTCTIGTQTPVLPQGRITYSSGVPVMNSDVAGGLNIYYAPVGTGRFVPIYNGTNIRNYLFTSSATDTVGLTLFLNSSANWTANTLYDVFVGLNAGSPVLCTGPAYSNSGAGTSARSASIAMYLGLPTNSASMTCRTGASTTITCAINQCTQVGTALIGASAGTVDFRIGSAASAAGDAYISLCNLYNPQNIYPTVIDTKASWTAPASGPLDNSSTYRVSVVSCNGTTPLSSFLSQRIQVVAGGGSAWVQFGLNSTTVQSTKSTRGLVINNNAGGGAIIDIASVAFSREVPVLGFGWVQAQQVNSGSANTFFGGTAGDSVMESQWVF